jgi:hypothetical protein
MPQLQLPIFPGGVAYITKQLAFKKKDGQITDFNGPVTSKGAAPPLGGGALLSCFSNQSLHCGNALLAQLPSGQLGFLNGRISFCSSVPLLSTSRRSNS